MSLRGSTPNVGLMIYSPNGEHSRASESFGRSYHRRGQRGHSFRREWRTVFEDSEKIFRLSNKVGVATYGLAGMEGRSIGSFVREFARDNSDLESKPIKEIVDDLRAFFLKVYIRYAEALYGKPFADIPANEKGVLGLIVAGFSLNEFLSEAWEIRIPLNDSAGSARNVCAPGNFSVSWFASIAPIERYILGFDRGLLIEVSGFIQKLLGRPLSQAEMDEFAPIREKCAYRVMLDSMPIRSGVEYVKFLVQLAIQHFRFASTHPTVGGKARIGVVTYKQEGFRILG